MLAALFKDSPATVKILFSGFILLVGFTIFMVIGMIFSYFLFDISFNELSGKIDPTNPKNIPVMKFLQACFSIGLFVFPPFLIAFFIHGKISEYLKLGTIPAFYTIILALSLILFSMPFVNYLSFINEHFKFPDSLKGLENMFKNLESDAKKTSDSFLAATSIGGLFINLILVAVIPALGEELLFRGVFQRLFHEWTKNIHFAIFLSAFIFSALHMQFYGTLPRLFLGMMFGYMFYWSKNLWLPIISHLFNNAIAVIFMYSKGNIPERAESLGTDKGSAALVLISLLSVFALLYLIYRAGKEQTNNKLNPNPEKNDN